MMLSKIIAFAKNFGYDDAEFDGRYKGADVYVLKNNKPLVEGYPQFLIVQDDSIEPMPQEDADVYFFGMTKIG